MPTTEELVTRTRQLAELAARRDEVETERTVARLLKAGDVIIWDDAMVCVLRIWESGTRYIIALVTDGGDICELEFYPNELVRVAQR